MPENEKTLTLEAGGFEIQAAAEAGADGKPSLPKFRMEAYTGAPMKLEGWRYPVVVDLAGLAIPSQKRPIRFGHASSSGIGHTDTIAVEAGSLIATGVVSRDTVEAKEVVASSKNGFPWQASIGASVQKHEFVKDGDAVDVNGRKIPGPVNVVRRSTLGEISFVDLGADGNTSATIAARAAKEQDMPDDDKAKEEGKVEAGKVETPVEKNKEENISARNGEIDQMLADAYRRKAIMAMATAAASECPDDPDQISLFRDLEEEHIKAGTSAKDFEVVLLRKKRPPAGGRGPNNSTTGEVIAAAAMISGLGDDVALKVHGERNVAAARKKFGHDIGLQEIMLLAARANGYHGRDRVTVGNWREIWAFAAGGDIRAGGASGFSTVNLPTILGDVANKAIGKVAMDQTWVAPLITGKASHSNFFAHTVFSMGMNGTLEAVGPGGELKHVSLGQDTYTRQIGTRGAVLRLSRTDIINDDMGVFAKNAQTMVRKSYNAREKALFTLINASGAGTSHFTAARGNYITGATTVAGTLAGMDAAVKAFRKMTGMDGEPIGVEPAIVLVNPTYEASMNSLLGATTPALIATGVGNTALRSPAFNVYSGRFGGRALVSPWLEATSAGGSDAATSWYLFADPNILPVYEIAYLNGQEQPTVEYFGLESEVDTLGVAWRIYWDFGVSAAEWRAGVKIAGA